MPTDWLFALLGGVLIGLSVTAMLWLNGRVTGISGIFNGLLSYKKGDMSWRAAFIGGLILGGFVVELLHPGAVSNVLDYGWGTAAVAGLFVGFGTVLGSGCTSGHGVCGMSRLSPRSTVATLTFMGLGVVTVYVFRHMMGGN